MNVILWLLFGALAGWLASIVMGTNARMGLGSNILYGVVGSAVGGFLASLLGLGSVTGFNLTSILIAAVGACLCLALVNWLHKVKQ